MTTKSATLIGFTAIALWAMLAAFTVATGRVPAFQLAAITFTIGGAVGVIASVLRGRAAMILRQPAAAWAVGVSGLFGYHALYFLSLRLAPPAEAGLINYLWPLLIVVFSAFLPNEKLRWHHVAGALLGLAGTVTLFAGSGSSGFVMDYAPGFAAAFIAAFIWAAYSVMSRRLADVPTDAVAGFCLATAFLAALFHFIFEETVWPNSTMQWLAILALGAGPVGAAFYAWDIGMKRGDIRIVGAASYATPLLSTGLLVVMGYAQPSTSLALATVLIAGGGLLAAKDLLFRKSN
jgi:drug/metabolite transporter (DMT)-like permease